MNYIRPLASFLKGESIRKFLWCKILRASFFRSEKPEFLFDHVLRKVMMGPHEHVDWPPVLKLLYTFHYEKEYLNDPAFIIEVIDDLDPQFIDALRNRFS